ncbi:MAG: hypothetical protein EZS28_020006 [Streblomastix strix]|uniref:Uncharacterized protein n=1 Tax=Streblomastix strix TaxID=222440 RepID=A0A5J4VPP7_9EUKA|nr:MAG: hypothetical protein EZS28_020006 [Streblomastix strix]
MDAITEDPSDFISEDGQVTRPQKPEEEHIYVDVGFPVIKKAEGRVHSKSDEEENEENTQIISSNEDKIEKQNVQGQNLNQIPTDQLQSGVLKINNNIDKQILGQEMQKMKSILNRMSDGRGSGDSYLKSNVFSRLYAIHEDLLVKNLIVQEEEKQQKQEQELKKQEKERELQRRQEKLKKKLKKRKEKEEKKQKQLKLNNNGLDQGLQQEQENNKEKEQKEQNQNQSISSDSDSDSISEDLNDSEIARHIRLFEKGQEFERKKQEKYRNYRQFELEQRDRSHKPQINEISNQIAQQLPTTSKQRLLHTESQLRQIEYDKIRQERKEQRKLIWEQKKMQGLVQGEYQESDEVIDKQEEEEEIKKMLQLKYEKLEQARKLRSSLDGYNNESQDSIDLDVFYNQTQITDPTQKFILQQSIQQRRLQRLLKTKYDQQEYKGFNAPDPECTFTPVINKVLPEYIQQRVSMSATTSSGASGSGSALRSSFTTERQSNIGTKRSNLSMSQSYSQSLVGQKQQNQQLQDINETPNKENVNNELKDKNNLKLNQTTASTTRTSQSQEGTPRYILLLEKGRELRLKLEQKLKEKEEEQKLEVRTPLRIARERSNQLVPPNETFDERNQRLFDKRQKYEQRFIEERKLLKQTQLRDYSIQSIRSQRSKSSLSSTRIRNDLNDKDRKYGGENGVAVQRYKLNEKLKEKEKEKQKEKEKEIIGQLKEKQEKNKNNETVDEKEMTKRSRYQINEEQIEEQEVKELTFKPEINKAIVLPTDDSQQWVENNPDIQKHIEKQKKYPYHSPSDAFRCRNNELHYNPQRLYPPPPTKPVPFNLGVKSYQSKKIV